jgi:hypothetical protein
MQKKSVLKLMLLLMALSLVMTSACIVALSHTPIGASQAGVTQSGASSYLCVNCDSTKQIPCCPPGCGPGVPGCPPCVRC